MYANLEELSWQEDAPSHWDMNDSKASLSSGANVLKEYGDGSVVADDAIEPKSIKKNKKTKRSKDNTSFTSKAKKRHTDRVIDKVQAVSSEKRENLSQDINKAYLQAALVQKKADAAQLDAAKVQAKADELTQVCIQKLCDAIQAGSFNVSSGKTNDIIQQKANDLDEKRETLKSMTATKNKMYTALDAALARKTEAAQEVSTYEKQISDMQDELEKAFDEASTLKIKNEARAELQRKRSDLEDHLSDLESDIVALEKFIHIKGVDKNTKERKQSTLKEKRSAKSLAEKDLRAIIDAMAKSAVQEQHIDFSDFSIKIEDISTKLVKVRLKARKADNAVILLKKKISQTEEEISAIENNITPLEDDLRQFMVDSVIAKISDVDGEVSQNKVKSSIRKKYSHKSVEEPKGSMDH